LPVIKSIEERGSPVQSGEIKGKRALPSDFSHHEILLLLAIFDLIERKKEPVCSKMVEEEYRTICRDFSACGVKAVNVSG